jgi:ATP-dependent RNA helicase DeaD
MFEVPRAVAGRFAAALKRTGSEADGEGDVRIEAVEGGPREAARHNRRPGPPPGHRRPQHAPRGKPHRGR